MKRMPLLLLALVLLLAGCVSIPVGGGVTTTDISVEAPDDQVDLPDRPQQDATPAEIITGFLLAGRASDDSYSIARQYLTDTFRSKWVPGAGALITTSALSPQEVEEGTWNVGITVTAQVDGHGRYTSGLSDLVPLAFTLVQDDEDQWRIDSAPNGVVLPSSLGFDAYYDAYQLYFFDPSYRSLVPELRWFPAGVSVAQRLVNELIAGPSPWLQGALVTAFPADTQGQAEPITDGSITIDFSAQVSAESGAARRRMQQQLNETLRALPTLTEVVMTVDKLDINVPDGAPPDSRFLVGSDPVAVVDGQVGVLTDDGLTRLDIGTAADQLDATGGAVSRNHDVLAVRGSGGAVYAVRPGAEAVVVDGRSGLIEPSLDAAGYVWTVPAGSPGGLQAAAPDGTVVTVPGLPADARVTALKVSRDGARLAAALSTASGPRVIVAGILRESGTPTRLVDPVLSLAISSAPVLDLTWVDGNSVAVLSGVDGDTSVDRYTIGGQREALGSPLGGVRIVGGNGVNGIRVLDTAGHVLRPGGGRSWQDTGLTASSLITQQ